jgi:hypothetical protein
LRNSRSMKRSVNEANGIESAVRGERALRAILAEA